jgi:hypothetical protein
MSVFRRTVAWLAVAALAWSSGQGVALSATVQLAGLGATNAWHCVMMPGGGKAPDDGAGHGQPGTPTSLDHGFCPVCSLTGCGAPSAVALAEFQYHPPGRHHVDAVQPPAAAPHVAADYHRPRTRAPPLPV